MSRVDVIIPAHNAALYIAQALASVMAQGDCVARIIVVDDGSTDGTAACVHEFAAAHPQVRVECLQQRNAGPSAARNRGLALARAEFVAMLDADDVWSPEKLRRQLALFDSAGGDALGVVYCGYGLISESGQAIENRGFRLDPRVRGNIASRLLEANLVAGSASAVLIRRRCLDHVGFFDESLVCAEDWDLWLRLAEHYLFDYAADELVWLRQHPRNAQKNERRMLGGELLFLNKLYLRRKVRWYHLARLWRRLALGGYDARKLEGFASCSPRVQTLVAGPPMAVFRRALHAYLYARGLARRFLVGRRRVPE